MIQIGLAKSDLPRHETAMNWPVPVTDPDDPSIEQYRNIRDRDLIGRRGVFIAEGSVVLRRLLMSHDYALQSALILENRLIGLEDAVEQMRQRHVPVYSASREVIDTIAGFPMHRGVMAIGSAHQVRTVGSILSALPHQAIVVVCVGIANHDNIGAIFRNARGLGADAVLYDPTSCDPFYRKSIRVSVGAVFELPSARFDTVPKLRTTLRAAGFHELALSPSGQSELRELPVMPRIALYLGAEGTGLSEDLIADMNGVRIDMATGFDSLNVAATSAIALYQLQHRRN